MPVMSKASPRGLLRPLTAEAKMDRTPFVVTFTTVFLRAPDVNHIAAGADRNKCQGSQGLNKNPRINSHFLKRAQFTSFSKI